MFTALAVGVFFALLFFVRRRDRRAFGEIQRLYQELSQTQRELEKTENRVKQLIGFLNALHEHKVAPTGKLGWDKLADFIVQTASPMIGTATVVLLRWDPASAEYRGVAARGLAPQRLAALRVQPGEGVLGRAAEGKRPVIVQEASAAEPPLPTENFLSVPYLILPLWVHSQVSGLLALCRPTEGRIGPDPMRLATLLAKQVELTMENLDLYENRQRVYIELVATLMQALAAKEAPSSTHTDQCRTLIRDLAREMHLPELLAEQIEFGVMLHDVGKLGISETLLKKNGPLTEDEYAAMKKHPQIGYDLLRNVDFLRGVAPIVLYHHEWVNGQGYPEGLAGEEIPIGARMVGIVDAWDAMTTDQPYRKALPKNNAIAELRQQAGTQFDPKLIDVFLRIVTAHPNA